MAGGRCRVHGVVCLGDWSVRRLEFHLVHYLKQADKTLEDVGDPTASPRVDDST